MQAGVWVIVLLTLPETLFSRRDFSRLEKRSYVQRLMFHGKVLDRKIHARDFIGSLRMAQYLAVLLPAVWYMTANTYGKPPIFAHLFGHPLTLLFYMQVVLFSQSQVHISALRSSASSLIR
jgi:hypothetical protein